MRSVVVAAAVAALAGCGTDRPEETPGVPAAEPVDTTPGPAALPVPPDTLEAVRP